MFVERLSLWPRVLESGSDAPDWLTFIWYIKFVPGEARNPRLNKSSDVLSVYCHLTGGLANAGRCHLADVWWYQRGFWESGACRSKRHISPTHHPPLPSFPPGPLAHLICCNYATKDAAWFIRVETDARSVSQESHFGNNGSESASWGCLTGRAEKNITCKQISISLTPRLQI